MTPGDMRREQQPARALAFEREQRVVVRRRLGGIDVDRRAAEMARRKMRGERRLVDDAAARGLDQDRARFHRPERTVIDHAARLRDQRHMQRHHVGGGQQLVERQRLRAQRLRRAEVARRRIVKADAAAHAVERSRHRQRRWCRSRRCRPAGRRARPDCRPACGRENPRSVPSPISALAQASRRSSIDADVTAYSATALLLAPAHVGDRNAKPRQRRLVEPVDAGAGHLHERQRAALEQRGRQLRADRRE